MRAGSAELDLPVAGGEEEEEGFRAGTGNSDDDQGGAQLLRQN